MNRKPAPQLSEAAKQFQHGTYRHFKGGMYKTLCIAHDSENIERELVIYQSLDEGYVCARPLEMFLETVDKPEYNGPRFEFIK